MPRPTMTFTVGLLGVTFWRRLFRCAAQPISEHRAGPYTLFEVTNSPAVQRYADAAVLILLPITVAYLWLGVRAMNEKVLCHERSIRSGPHIGARHTSGNPPELHLS
jgi:hypothetical protein